MNLPHRALEKKRLCDVPNREIIPATMTQVRVYDNDKCSSGITTRILSSCLQRFKIRQIRTGTQPRRNILDAYEILVHTQIAYIT